MVDSSLEGGNFADALAELHALEELQDEEMWILDPAWKANQVRSIDFIIFLVEAKSPSLSSSQTSPGPH